MTGEAVEAFARAAILGAQGTGGIPALHEQAGLSVTSGSPLTVREDASGLEWMLEVRAMPLGADG